MTVFTLWAIANLGAQKLEFPKNIPRTPSKPQFNPPSNPTLRPPSNQRSPSNNNRPSIPTPQFPSNYPNPVYFPQNGMPGRTTSNNPNGISEYLYRAPNNIPDKNGVTHVTFLSSQIQYRMYNWPLPVVQHDAWLLKSGALDTLRAMAPKIETFDIDHAENTFNIKTQSGITL